MEALSTTTQEWVGVYTVDVVDSMGEGIADEPVEARYDLGDGRMVRADSITDGNGRAIFADRLPAAPRSVEVEAAGGSWLGPDPVAQSTIVIEV